VAAVIEVELFAWRSMVAMTDSAERQKNPWASGARHASCEMEWTKNPTTSNSGRQYNEERCRWHKMPAKWQLQTVAGIIIQLISAHSLLLVRTELWQVIKLCCQILKILTTVFKIQII
jgi:hypothetical protein